MILHYKKTTVRRLKIKAISKWSHIPQKHFNDLGLWIQQMSSKLEKIQNTQVGLPQNYSYKLRTVSEIAEQFVSRNHFLRVSFGNNFRLFCSLAKVNGISHARTSRRAQAKRPSVVRTIVARGIRPKGRDHREGEGKSSFLPEDWMKPSQPQPILFLAANPSPTPLPPPRPHTSQNFDFRNYNLTQYRNVLINTYTRTDTHTHSLLRMPSDLYVCGCRADAKLNQQLARGPHASEETPDKPVNAIMTSKKSCL